MKAIELLFIGGGLGGLIYLLTKPQQAKAGSPTNNNSGAIILKKGDTGTLVMQLQKALVQMGGNPKAFIMNSGGVDGIFGSGTENALLSAGYPKELTEAVFNQIVLKTGKSNESIQNSVSGQFVASRTYTPLYKTPGSDPITVLEPKVFIGALTGKVNGSLAEVSNTISLKPYKYWIATNKVNKYVGLNAINQAIIDKELAYKSESTKQKILAAFS